VATLSTTAPSKATAEPAPALISNGGGGCVSFILRTPPIPGKFLVEKAMALGIPKGPLYRQLKMGQNVSFVDTVTNETKHIQSSDVVEPSTPPIVIMVLYYPTQSVAQQLFASKYLRPMNENEQSNETTIPELVIHITSSSLFHQFGKDHWKESHGKSNTSEDFNSRKVDHIFLPLHDIKGLSNETHMDDSTTSPFRSAMLGAYARSLIHSDIYVHPNIQVQSTPTITTNDKHSNDSADEYCIGQPTMEYTILPRSKRGFVPVVGPYGGDDLPTITTMADQASMEQLVEQSGAQKLAKEIIEKHVSNSTSLLPSNVGELIFTGTASALPCKHRNVTGMLLKQSDNRSIVLDIGEGTMGQLLRMRSSGNNPPQPQQCRDLYNEIKAVWISHPHADHHLGLIRLLKDRRQLGTEKLLIIAPTPIFRFLDDLSVIDNEIQGSYISIDCKDLVGESPEFLPHQQTIQDVLGITRCRAVPVAHCAHAYAVILDGTSFGRVVYSGDCRPSTQLALTAKGADVLIHESTFESDMQADAVYKKHSTIDEALHVGRQMECKCIILTHFSQRYSKVPPLPSKSEDDYPFPIIYAYDFMKVQPHTLLLASKLTPALRLLFAEDTVENCADEADGLDAIESFSGADILSIPGAFANASLL
jgi:ribonuclease Z